MSAPSFIAVDWGTSSFRLWVLSQSGVILSESRGPDGMLSAAREGFANVLDRHLYEAKAPVDLPILACGMVGARGGWMEAGYVETPAALSDIAGSAVKVDHATRDIRILPGLCQKLQGRPDVMRGEETQLLGASSAIVGNARVGNAHVVMPGTHSKWVAIEDGHVTGFSTFMTGELYDTITKHTILAAPDGVAPEGETSAAFLDAVRSAFASPGRLTSQLFAARSGQILNGISPAAALAHISGTLIGAEIGGATSSRKTGTVCLVASGRLATLYESALKAVGINFNTIDADDAVRHGLQTAAAHIWSTR